MIDKLTQNRIKASFRKIWLWSDERKECMNRNKIKRGQYRCEKCLEGFKREEVQIHHIIEVGSMEDIGEFCERLFCESDKLMCVCKACHKEIHKNK